MKTVIYIISYPFYLLYLGIMFIRNLLFDLNLLSSKKLECTVISVGNISFGGTGKTPFTIALADELKSKYRVAILSRGYKRDSRGTVLVSDGNNESVDWKIVGDEPYLITQKLSGVPVVVDEDRFRGGKYLVDNFNPEIIILDDGFQHRKLLRDIDIVLVDGSIQSGLNYWREPFGAIKRADTILLTKVNDNKTWANWKNRLSAFKKPTFTTNNKTDETLPGLKETALNTEHLNGKSVITFSGIANHESFNNTANQLGCEIVYSISFKDHHNYMASDLEKLAKMYSKLKPDYLLTTEKDIIKLPQSNLPIYALSISMELPNELIDNIENNIRLLDK